MAASEAVLRLSPAHTPAQQIRAPQSRATRALAGPKHRVTDLARPQQFPALEDDLEPRRLAPARGRKVHQPDNRLRQPSLAMFHIDRPYGAQRCQVGATDVGMQRREGLFENGFVGRAALRRRNRETHAQSLPAELHILNASTGARRIPRRAGR